MKVSPTSILFNLRLQVPQSTYGWVVLCRAIDYLHWQTGETSYYDMESPSSRRWWLRFRAWTGL
jgi:hypothetical protein